MEVPDHNKFMQRCLDLALMAEGMTYPNPMVGAVIVRNGIIIGEGYHIKAGDVHAEVQAVNSVTDKTVLRESTLYVSLEPCSHQGRTPPCTDLIIRHRIPEIVIGTKDTSEKVAGRGISILKGSGCKVTTGILEKECRKLNKRFFTWHEKKRPYIILKWAQSADGYVDIIRDKNSPVEPNWISGRSERILVHKWRAAEQSILVGAGTIRKDNPLLNVRDWSGSDPVKIILSGSGDLGDYLSSAGSKGPVIVFTENNKKDTGKALKVLLTGKAPAAEQILDYLYKEGIQSLFIEGGSSVLNHFIGNNSWDEARIITGTVKFREGIKAPAISGYDDYFLNFETTKLQVVLRRELQYLPG